MTDRPLSSYKIANEERDLIENIQSRAIELAEILEDYQSIYDEKTLEDAVITRAFRFSYELVEERALDFILIEAKKAIIESVEFNYPPFITHFLSAIISAYNKGDFVSIVVDDEFWRVREVEINPTMLGNLETYAQAVQNARESLNIGKIEKPEIRSRIWREKIYGVAREGVRVLKRYKGKIVKLKDEFGRETEHHYGDTGEEGATTRDITSRYKDKYKITIEERLSFISEDEAPFWELIEYGSIGMGSDIGGEPYPIVQPTGFIDKIRRALTVAVRNAFEFYRDEADLFLSGLVASDYGLEGITESVRDLPDLWRDEVAKSLSAEKIAEARQSGTTKAIETIRVDNTITNTYVTNRGNLRTTVHGAGGRFVSPKSLGK